MLGIGAISFMHLPLPAPSPAMRALSGTLAYILLALVGATGAALLYRYGPSRAKAK